MRAAGDSSQKLSGELAVVMPGNRGLSMRTEDEAVVQTNWMTYSGPESDLKRFHTPLAAGGTQARTTSRSDPNPNSSGWTPSGVARLAIPIETLCADGGEHVVTSRDASGVANVARKTVMQSTMSVDDSMANVMRGGL